MPNDAKLGLVAGVAVVVLIAAIFFRKDPVQADPTIPGAPPPNTWTPQLPPAPQLPSAGDGDNPPLPPPPMLSGTSQNSDRHAVYLTMRLPKRDS